MLDSMPDIYPFIIASLALALAAVLVMPPLFFRIFFGFLGALMPSRRLELTLGAR